MTRVAKVFELNRQGFRPAPGRHLRGHPGAADHRGRAPSRAGVLPDCALWGAVGGPERPWRDYDSRVPRMAIFAVAGALLTALGFGVRHRGLGLGGAGRVRRDRLRAAVAQCLLDARRRHHCHEAQLAAVHLRRPQRVAGTVVGAADDRSRPAGGRQQDRPRGDHCRLVRIGGVDPHRELRLVLRRHGRGHPDRHRCAPPVQPHGRGTADPVDTRQRRGRRHRHVPRRPASEARRQSGAASTCCPRAMRRASAGQGAVGPVPGTRPRATASMV